MNKDKLIVAQVVFKGAIDLVANKNIELDEISSFMSKHIDEIMQYAENPAGNNGQPPFKKTVNLPAESDLVCPICKSMVYDNRETKTSPNQPNFKCSNTKTCEYGKEYKGKKSPWASWSDEPTLDMKKGYVPQVAPEANPDDIF